MQAGASRVNKLRVVLDTNIYVSSAFWEGKPYRIVQRALNDEFSVFVSEDIIKELKRVLARDFGLADEAITENIDAILTFAKKIEINQNVSVVKDDPDDDRIIECALSAKAQYVITQDNHLLKLKEFRGIKLLSPTEFLDFLEKKA